MTIAELIKLLTKTAAQTGANVPVIVSSDPEGNSYMSLAKHYSIQLVYDEQFYKQDFTPAEFEKEHSKHIIGVCIYPFTSGSDSPEDAINGI